MTMVRTVAPTVLAVDLALIKKNMVIDGDYMDDVVTEWTRGVIASLEHQIGQCLMEQTWRVTLPAFSSSVLLPHPAMNIVSVKYIDLAGEERTMAANEYRLEIEAYRSILRPARGAGWPGTYVDTFADPEDPPPSVFVEVKCGHGSTPDKTPESAQVFILGKLVEQYDPKTRLERDTVQSIYLDQLIDDLRTYA
jgi:uncharacterized phiE125 gp8 family phage protein